MINEAFIAKKINEMAQAIPSLPEKDARYWVGYTDELLELMRWVATEQKKEKFSEN